MLQKIAPSSRTYVGPNYGHTYRLHGTFIDKEMVPSIGRARIFSSRIFAPNAKWISEKVYSASFLYRSSLT